MANKKFYYKKRKPAASIETQEAEKKQTARYTEQQLTLPLEELELCDTTRALLFKNHVRVAGDIVKRTEKDMYKIQGLNKKILIEVKNALRRQGMALRVEDLVQEKQSQSEPSQDGKGVKPEQKSGKKSRFGLADRDDESQKQPSKKQAKNSDKQGKNSVKQEKSERPEKPEKLKEPLKMEEWRKVLKGGKWGYSNGFSIVIPTMYDEIFAFKEGLASVEIDEKCGYIDGEGNLVIPLMYDTAMSFSEGLAMVCVGEKCGYINKQNEMVIAPEFDAATPFENGEAKVKKDGKWATITPSGSLTWI